MCEWLILLYEACFWGLTQTFIERQRWQGVDKPKYWARNVSNILLSELNLLNATSGHTAVSHQKWLMVIDNGEGFSTHHLQTGTYIHSFPTGKPMKRYPKQVAFGEHNSIIVGGSDHSAVYVFDHDTSGPLDLLCHSDPGLVQTITVSC